MFAAPSSKDSSVRIALMYFSLNAWLPYTAAIALAGLGLADGCYRFGHAPGADALIYILVIPAAIWAVLSGFLGAVLGVCYGKAWTNKFLTGIQS